MSYAFDSRLGKQLYQLLPEIYRTRDKEQHNTASSNENESLAKFLDAQGHLLDLIHATLEQQLKDTLPKSSQDWLLPYFAQLLAANIVSPDPAGKHAEVAHAVLWRQRKGTLKCIEEIAEAIGQIEVEIQEGWKRVAITPRIGMPIILAAAIDDTLALDLTIPSHANRHPALPVGTVDFRHPSRAIIAEQTNPATITTHFGGILQHWRQSNVHGVPCFPNHFDDVSRRTVDFRTPSATHGHYHHKNLLAFAPPPEGLFTFDAIPLTWDSDVATLPTNIIQWQKVDGVITIRNISKRVIDITNDITLGANNYHIEGINFSSQLSIADGGHLVLSSTEVNELTITTFSEEQAVLSAQNCLFNKVSVGSGIAEMDNCTVLAQAFLKTIKLTNSIIMSISDANIAGTIEYSRIPANILSNTDIRTVENCVADEPKFFANQVTLAANAVLTPNTPKSIYLGAKNKNEMGYFNQGRKNNAVRIASNFTNDDALKLPKNGGYPLSDVIFEGDVEVDTGSFVIGRCGVKSITVKTALLIEDNFVSPALNATDCLFGDLKTNKGLTRLEYCTILNSADCLHLQASDCIFAGTILGVKKQITDKTPALFENCLRFSVIPSEFLKGIKNKPNNDPDKRMAFALHLIDENGNLTLKSNTLDKPTFVQFDYCQGGIIESRVAKYGESGCGVLDSVSPETIRFGAEDSSEMGVYHHKYYSLKAAAMLDKMREFLPVGFEPVLIQDTRLLHQPPKQTS